MPPPLPPPTGPRLCPPPPPPPPPPARAAPPPPHPPPIPPLTGLVICTRNRPESLPRAVAAALSSDHPSFHLVVVDQSDASLPPFPADPRLTILPAPPAGLSAARNAGARLLLARGVQYLAFTDDDCRPPPPRLAPLPPPPAPHPPPPPLCRPTPSWLSAITRPLEDDPTVGLVFGVTRAAPYDRSLGLIPAYEIPAPKTVRGLANKAKIEGIGASMALRAAVFTELDGFEPAFGGGPFRSADDTDIAIRTLLAGHAVHETPHAVTLHDGFRPWTAAPALIDAYLEGIGGAYARMLRLAGLRALPPFAALALRWLSAKPVVDLNHTPPRTARLGSFLRGFRTGLRHFRDNSTSS